MMRYRQRQPDHFEGESTMKVFAFDPTTGRKGPQIGESIRPDALSNMHRFTCPVPRNTATTSWRIATEAADIRNRPIKFDRPVCFCLGQQTAGTDTTWVWYALVPQGAAA